MEEQKTKIYSAFPGTGKSSYCRKFLHNSDKIVLDSDSSKFNKSDFPNNYINHIKNNINKVHIIFVSSHIVVREALEENKLQFTLIYPNMTLKNEYLERYRNRGNSSLFIKLIDENWDRWIYSCYWQNPLSCKHIVLPSMTFIDDVL